MSHELQSRLSYIALTLSRGAYSAGARSARMRMRTQCTIRRSEYKTSRVFEAFTICDRKAIIILLRGGADAQYMSIRVRVGPA